MNTIVFGWLKISRESVRIPSWNLWYLFSNQDKGPNPKVTLSAEVRLFQGTVVAMYLPCLPVISILQAFTRVICLISCVYAHDLSGSCYSYKKLVHPCCMRMCPTDLWSKTSRCQKETHHLSATTHEYCTEEKFWVALQFRSDPSNYYVCLINFPPQLPLSSSDIFSVWLRKYSTKKKKREKRNKPEKWRIKTIQWEKMT